MELKKGETIMIDAALHLPASFLHEAFSNRSGMPPDHFELYYRGKRLEGEAALASWGVGKGSTIEVKMRGRGGTSKQPQKPEEEPFSSDAKPLSASIVDAAEKLSQNMKHASKERSKAGLSKRKMNEKLHSISDASTTPVADQVKWEHKPLDKTICDAKEVFGSHVGTRGWPSGWLCMEPKGGQVTLQLDKVPHPPSHPPSPTSHAKRALPRATAAARHRDKGPPPRGQYALGASPHEARV